MSLGWVKKALFSELFSLSDGGRWPYSGIWGSLKWRYKITRKKNWPLYKKKVELLPWLFYFLPLSSFFDRVDPLLGDAWSDRSVSWSVSCVIDRSKELSLDWLVSLELFPAFIRDPDGSKGKKGVGVIYTKYYILFKFPVLGVLSKGGRVKGCRVRWGFFTKCLLDNQEILSL